MRITVLVSLFVALSTSLQLYPLTSSQYNTLTTLADSTLFTLNSNVYYAKVQSIYDGDTLKAIFKFDDKFQKFDVRLNFIDTPQVSTGLVKPFGAQVRDILKTMILGKIVRLQCSEFDKYGRLLATVLAQSSTGTLININTYLAEHGMAKYYYGGTKQEFTQTDYDYFINNFKSTVWPTFVNYPLQP